MIDPENKLFAPSVLWNSAATREQQRLQTLTELGLRRLETIPIFEEATQTAAHFLAAEISILGFIDHELHWFKSSVGLSRLGLMNDLARNRHLSRKESFCTQVVETVQVLVIDDTSNFPQTAIANSKLVQIYGIRSYLGAPLVDSQGNCLGSLAVMDRKPRSFTERDIEFLQIIARWSMSEFERNRLLQQASLPQANRSKDIHSANPEYTVDLKISPPIGAVSSDFTKQIKLELLRQLTQELRTPLTSVLGMASVLGREIYGPLTTKQREYLEIIQHSGRYLLSLVNEITELGAMNASTDILDITTVDIEMLCQQAIKTLEEVAGRREQDICLSIEPGHSRTLSLDKDKVRQIIYHLVFSVIQLSPTGSVVRIHVSFKENMLCIAVWVSHPWLGDGITEVDSYFNPHALSMLEMTGNSPKFHPNPQNQAVLSTLGDESIDLMGNSSNLSNNVPREKLGLVLSCQLAQLHGGQISIQGSSESGYRYLLSLPQKLTTSSEIRVENIS
jgi:signal transduction histidine kinase